LNPKGLVLLFYSNDTSNHWRSSDVLSASMDFHDKK
jgi:hypothetical protein